jgi:hypothetical protein
MMNHEQDSVKVLYHFLAYEIMYDLHLIDSIDYAAIYHNIQQNKRMQKKLSAYNKPEIKVRTKKK